MKIYNTLSRSLEEFKPLHDKLISFYHCGPTVYWVQHIGNLRAMVWADLIRRSLQYLDYKVKFVRNYTDVGHLTSDEDEGEDKMEKGARRENLTPKKIADKYIKIFEKDTSSLNILEPDFKPRASEYVKEMLEMIKDLLDKGFAYITNQAIVYDISKFPNYNKLNHQKLDENIKGEGKGKIEDPQKRHFADFNLWVFKKGAHANALQTWPSEWGEGFPGWHIECSVMAKKLLGETIDIHMGGVEHISVHHTNEIAQSEAVTGKKFVNYWLHNEHLDVNARKMAKSEGTGFTLNQIIEKGFDPMDLRYFFLSAHYRSKQNFTWEGLQAAKNARLKIINLSFVDLIPSDNNQRTLSAKANEYKKKFNDFISNDFQIPQALALVWNLLKDESVEKLEKVRLMLDFDKVFVLDLDKLPTQNIIPAEIMVLAKKRLAFRKEGDFTAADVLRKKIKKKGYLVEDKLINNILFFTLKKI